MTSYLPILFSEMNEDVRKEATTRARERERERKEAARRERKRESPIFILLA